MTQFLTFCLSLSGIAYRGTLNEPVISIAASFPSKSFLVGTEGVFPWVGDGIDWETESYEISREPPLKYVDGDNCLVNEDCFLLYWSVSAAMKGLEHET